MSNKEKAAITFLSLFAILVSYFYCGPSHGDDTFIYMEYVDNALSGNGFVFNEGEKSYGVTSPLWTFLCTPSLGYWVIL